MNMNKFEKKYKFFLQLLKDKLKSKCDVKK